MSVVVKGTFQDRLGRVSLQMHLINYQGSIVDAYRLVPTSIAQQFAPPKQLKFNTYQKTRILIIIKRRMGRQTCSKYQVHSKNRQLSSISLTICIYSHETSSNTPSTPCKNSDTVKLFKQASL